MTPDFADGENLYDVLGLDSKASVADIRRAYRNLALKHHPDKAGGSAESNQRFQQIGYAYSILSDDKRRAKYDATGSTEDSIFDGPVDWDEYFRTLWSGEVSAKTLEEFQRKYQGVSILTGSDEERNDIVQAYRDSEGDIERIFAAVPCSNILTDQDRFVEIIDTAISNGDIKKTKIWSKLRTEKGATMLKKLRDKAQKEAAQAEEYARELGVWDQLFGDKKDAPGKAKAKKHTPKAQEEDEADDLDGIRAAIAAKANKRAGAFDDMISRLEAKHTTTRKRRRS
ncbi:hypothetical protein MCUN1_002287 [Malassezia cuniculi]|uniref:J domain-containing protein n=1 Tax=Malassezia cuniculi TaxID=948313 RepID=A0AAF0ERB5_9BASI|nr:hypothetical protein MCUN1_002287 [Malassezia cuniculi]